MSKLQARDAIPGWKANETLRRCYTAESLSNSAILCTVVN
jgi:hypothetical protein